MTENLYCSAVGSSRSVLSDFSTDSEQTPHISTSGEKVSAMKGDNVIREIKNSEQRDGQTRTCHRELEESELEPLVTISNICQ